MKFQKGHKLNVGNTWNLGKKRPDSVKKQIGDSLRGVPKPWLAGKKFSKGRKEEMSKNAIKNGFGKWMKGRVS
ncbi:MAG: hypothetical protein AAB944_01470 [Patescibacteria group bacterium]